MVSFYFDLSTLYLLFRKRAGQIKRPHEIDPYWYCSGGTQHTLYEAYNVSYSKQSSMLYCIRSAYR
jgi:hypothetical protein